MFTDVSEERGITIFKAENRKLIFIVTELRTSNLKKKKNSNKFAYPFLM
jgi:hypothetical protein